MGTPIKFRMYGGTQVPQIQLIQQFEATAHRGNGKPYSDAKLVFSLGPTNGNQYDQITNFTVAADDSIIVEHNRDMESNASRLHVSFDAPLSTNAYKELVSAAAATSILTSTKGKRHLT